MRFILYCAACFACCQPVLAQHNVPDSPVKIAADRLFAMAQADYYLNLQGKALSPLADPCDVNSCKSSILPVTLIKFEGKRIDDANVALVWETSEETNNDYFEIERTLNPAQGFTAVGKVKGAGSTASVHRYGHTDPNEYAAYTYYRLKQVDFDNTYEYSTIIAIKASAATLTVTALPNPGQSKDMAFKISGLKVSEPFTSVIYDVRGTVVYSDNDPRILSEEQVIRPKLPAVSPGKYSIKIKSANRQAIGSFVVIP